MRQTTPQSKNIKEKMIKKVCDIKSGKGEQVLPKPLGILKTRMRGIIH